MAFLGSLVFPKRLRKINKNLLPLVMSIFTEPNELVLVPMVLAKIFQALSACSRGYEIFKHCNLLLQDIHLWSLVTPYEDGYKALISTTWIRNSRALETWLYK
ncbi:hypothetical protein HAX54_037335 [Datura stramonium]|uniref:Uncharacterized protein n=1 Tax=Datura stramonium TaxID=4076 RepID=A0ABS8RMJ9_DATST|nr:hypothetical protein [Datura stramonium]